MRIIPAIDIIDGKCVRLSQGDYNQKTVYGEDVLDVAKWLEGQGISYLHLVDLDGAKGSGMYNHKILQQIASKTKLHIDFGGGIKTKLDAQNAFDYGASQVTCGSMAVDHRETFLECLDIFGPERIILGADAKNNFIMTKGWLENTQVLIDDFIQNFTSHGLQYVISTDINKDGMLNGPSFDLYDRLVKTTNLNIIASGGITSMQDILQLNEIGCEGAIIGKAIYENKISISQLIELC
jgi:phosphoribosylformimino-5-aminoimidazole carboxamide ribotide isomerase